MSPVSFNRSLLLVALLQIAAVTATTDPVRCNGFFCPEDPYSRQSRAEKKTEEEPCVGFGCAEGDSQEESKDVSRSGSDNDNNNNMMGECTTVSLEMDTDSRPEDTVFELVCNAVSIWQYPSERIPQRGAHDKLSVDACVYLREETCCEFVIKDHARDGLMAGDYATLSLKVDGEEILAYNTMDSPPFESLTRTFGSACKDPEEVEETKAAPIESCEDEEDTLLRFEITLDDKPEETSWYLICDDETTGDLVTLWNKPRGTLTTPKEAIVETKCISSESTCAFSIVDSAGDGLDFGGYSLTFGDDLIDLYDTKPFQDKSYCIGHLCASNIQNAATQVLTSVPTENEDFSPQAQFEAMGDAVESVVGALVFDSKEEVGELAQRLFEDDDESMSGDLDTELNDDETVESSNGSKGQPSNQNRRPDSHFMSEGSRGVSLEAWAYAVLGVAALMGLILTAVACAMNSERRNNRASSSAARDALSPAKSAESDDASTFLGDEEDPSGAP